MWAESLDLQGYCSEMKKRESGIPEIRNPGVRILRRRLARVLGLTLSAFFEHEQVLVRETQRDGLTALG